MANASGKDDDEHGVFDKMVCNVCMKKFHFFEKSIHMLRLQTEYCAKGKVALL